MSGISLRPARSTDAGKVGAILSEFIDTTVWMPRVHTRAQDIGFAGQLIAQDWVIVATDAGRVTGFAAREGAQLHALYVAASSRRSGIGSALLRHMQQQADHLSLWTFDANVVAQQFYLRHGFVAMEQTDGAGNDEGLPDIRFEWTRKVPQ